MLRGCIDYGDILHFRTIFYYDHQAKIVVVLKSVTEKLHRVLGTISVSYNLSLNMIY